MRRLAWTFAARIGNKYQIRLTRPIWNAFERSVMNNYRIKPVAWSMAYRESQTYIYSVRMEDF